MVHWGTVIAIYLYLGGMAGGIYFISSIMELAGGERFRKAAEVGYVLSFVAIVLGSVFLILDLGRPGRFLEVLTRFKVTSPMSAGSWGVFAFSVWSFITVILVGVRGFLNSVIPRGPFVAVGGGLGAFLASYTGVLLSETSIPAWNSTPFLGPLFFASGVSTGIALLTLFARKRLDGDSPYRLELADNVAIGVELVILLFLFLQLKSLGVPNPITLHYPGLFWIGVILIGLVVPFVLNFSGIYRFRTKGEAKVSLISPILILIGGFILRYVVVISPQL